MTGYVHRSMWLAIVLGAACSGCVAESDQADIDDTEAELYGAPGLYWPANSAGVADVPVCWLTPGYATEKQWVRSSNEAFWGTYSGVRFSGWGDCNSSTPAYAVRIQVEDSGPRSYVGRTNYSPAMWLNFTYANWPCYNGSEYCTRGTSLHEFGHALGFWHEQDRPDNNGQCNSSIDTSHGGQTLGPYDGSSTMNYCLSPWGRNSISQGDIAGLQQVYGNKLEWRSWGTIAGQTCVLTNEPSDPHTWNDNYLCSRGDMGIRWSYAGPIGGMRCTLINEPGDAHAWNDNYLCVPTNSTLYFQWSYAGPIAGKSCIPWNEGADPDYWNDNYLCY